MNQAHILLPNGLRLISIARPGRPTVAVRVYVRAGSRYDVEHPLTASGLASRQPALGLAHLTEHLLFKGTHARSQQQLFAAIERLGGVLEAGTAKEYLTLGTVTAVRGLATALDVLAEVLTRPLLREEDFWQEKLVVLEEIRRARDRQEQIFDAFAQALWLAHPLRHPVLGGLEELRDLEYRSLLDFYRQRFVAGNMVLVVCGDVRPDEVQERAAARFADLPAGDEQPPSPVQEPALATPRTVHLERDLHQAHLLVGAPTVSMKHEDRSALKIVERVLGMGFSARLYRHLRQKARLVYNIRTATAHYEDAGYFAVWSACSPQRVTEVQAAILEEWARLGDEGLDDDELRAAKSNYAGTLARRFETNWAMAGIYGVEGLLHRVEPFEEAVARIEAVQSEDVQRVAREHLHGEVYVAVTLGRSNG